MTDVPALSVLEGGALTREQYRDQWAGPLRAFMVQLLGAGAETELTIADGTVTPAAAAHLVDTESDAAADDLDTLQVTNLPAGSIVQLRAVDAERVVTLKHGDGGSGQMLLERDSDVVLDAVGKRIWLQRIGTDWVELWRSWPVATDLPLSLRLSGIISPSQLTGDQDDYSPTGLADATTLRLTSDATRTITGLVPGAAAGGRVILIRNVGANPIVLGNQSAGSTAANRFLLGGNVTLQPNDSITLTYDGTTTRWRPMAMLPLLKDLPRVEVTDDTTIGAGHWGRMVVLTAASGGVDKDANLPAAASSAGRIVGIRNEDADDAFIIDGNASETIDGETTVSLAQGEWRLLWCDGTGWTSLARGGAASTEGPCFSAYVNSAQTTAPSTWTKMQAGTELYDSDSQYDAVTNYRFTPQTAGKYLCTIGALFSTGNGMDTNILAVALYKNGSVLQAVQHKGSGPTDNGILGTFVGTANGSSDYFEAFVYHASSNNKELAASQTYNFFTGHYLGS